MTNQGSGILQLTKNGNGHLVNPAKLTERIAVPARLIRDYQLPEGATVSGSTEGAAIDLCRDGLWHVAGQLSAANALQTPHRY
ncbi:MAG: hypothetical protein HC875_06065 [Anaerolineales bacterium]|nr:hypothetical protein [Anaerolineales bacterium]